MIRRLLKLSRPRFWMYLLGPFLVGSILGSPDVTSFLSLFFFAHIFYFLFVGNVLVYGINDIFDRDTDAYNTKKNEREYKFHFSDAFGVYVSVGLTYVLSLIFYFLQPNFLSTLFLLLFVGLSTLYSMPPIRFKARPFFDSWSNVLYLMPGFLAYAQFTNSINWWLLVPLGGWTAAMHLFSAIPDIVADKKAKVTTTAVLVGHRNSLFLCIVYWLIFSVGMLLFFDTYSALLLSVLYPFIPFVLLFYPKRFVEKVYWYFPLLNTILGGVLFWNIAIVRFF